MTRHIRPIRIDGNKAFVTLTCGCECVIDATDVPKINQGNWYAHKTKWTIYAARRKNGRIVRMHRQIMGEPSGYEVDHVDGNGLNNLRENLRIATSSQNKCNRTKGQLNTSGHKGVCLYKPNGKWRAYITVNGKQHSLGYFHTKDEAVCAYRENVSKFHGEFAKT